MHPLHVIAAAVFSLVLIASLVGMATGVWRKRRQIVRALRGEGGF